MDLSKMQRLTQGMKQLKVGSDGSMSEDEAADLNREGVYYAEELNDYARAIDCWKQAAKAGNAWAMRNIGFCYKNGDGVHQDNQEAFKWFKKAAERGNVESMFEVGICYYRGEVVPKDVVQSFSWCKKSADNGVVNAMNWVGSFYKDGEGVQQNFQEALRYFKKSGDGGNANAMLNAALMYDRGTGIPEDKYAAFLWYEKAAKAGNTVAMNNLANAYSNGSGCPASHEKAVEWYRKAIAEETDEELLKHFKENLDYIIARRYSSNDDSCFITTAVCESFGKSDDCYELTAFRNFRDIWLINQPDGKSLIDEYYKIAPKIVEKINSLSNSAEIYKNIWQDYLSKCLKSIEVGDNLNCKKIYVEMVNTLKEKFLEKLKI